MFDLKLNTSGDLYIGPEGDVATTDSVLQSVALRLKWFFDEWRLGPSFGFPYYEEVFVKNPNLTKIRYSLRDLVSAVDEVTEVTSVDISTDPQKRTASISVIFKVADETFKKEVEINA